MAALRILLTLSVCLLLGHQTCAKNDAPCQRTTWNKGYITFIQRHIPSGTPSSLDPAEWKNYIKNKTGCGRPTQSFLSPKDLDRVRDVCTKKGGKTYKDNLCISQQSFTFVTVRSEPGTCGIRSVQKENKHLILACEALGDDCLPVHFEGNPKNLKPNYNDKGCQDPKNKADTPSLRMTWLWLLSVLLFIIYGV